VSTLASVILRDITANRPAASIAGRLFFDTTLVKMQRDNGSSWDDVAETGSAGNVLSRTLVYRATDQNVSGSGTFTAVSYSDEVMDDGAIWAIGTPTQFVIPAGMNGREAILFAQLTWSASTAGNYRNGIILRNGADVLCNDNRPDLTTAIGINYQLHSEPVTLATSDTFEVQFRTDTTGIGMIGGRFSCYFGLYTVD
jgi:hypothetical protein